MYVSRQTICRWENGSRCPDLITAKKLALELKVSMDELISDEACRIFRLIMESGNQKK
ncbi:helix-turn-helix transcriptional regulator [Mediterraneibacter gnavus]|uniref:helix-turn-helix transcriptional regulator n=1 Tax=Mediterraneibacter gnavus TaxID=33038 RepID=UPI001FB97357|nr:helix-turn-helix transcriptional regulator [Mediterraneibacter gnavus]